MRISLLCLCSLGSLGVLAAAATGCENSEPIQLPEDLLVVPIAESPPPPLSGGTLIVSADEKRAIAADSDRDVIWVADLVAGELERTITLQPHDEPGRLVEDEAGLVHVALRGAGAVVTLNPQSGEILRRRSVCNAPRGLAFESATGQLHVACAEGKLVSLDVESGAAVRQLSLSGELRDVVVQGDKLLITRFHSAEILSLDATGALVGSAVPPVETSSAGDGIEKQLMPEVAWRAVPRPFGGMLMVHQHALLGEIETEEPSGYSNPGGGIVRGVLTQVDMDEDGTLLPPATVKTLRFSSVLPVDVAASKDGKWIAVAAAGSQTVLIVDPHEPAALPLENRLSGMPVAVAYGGTKLVVQVREPPAIEVLGQGPRIALPGASVRDMGYEMFHLTPGTFRGNDGFEGAGQDLDESAAELAGGDTLACASCHPEGGEDGHTWTFKGVGPRRTQSMRGGVLDTLPLHWDGDMSDVGTIMDEVFTHRMGGPRPGSVTAGALAHWIGTLPAPPPMRSYKDAPALSGRQIFQDESVGCAACHSGPHLTNNQNADIGKGQALQVPSLVGVAWRPPFMHDGCAATLADRFDPTCGGAKHGDISKLSSDDIADLVAYLESL